MTLLRTLRALWSLTGDGIPPHARQTTPLGPPPAHMRPAERHHCGWLLDPTLRRQDCPGCHRNVRRDG